MKMETTKRWGLMLTNMCYLPYFFFSPSEAADFLNVHHEYKERKIRVVPVQEIHMVEDKQTFYEELQQIRNRILTGNC